MPHELRFDSTTPEGQAIVELFTTVKQGIDGDWDGEDLINGLVGWFASLGFDLTDDPPPVATGQGSPRHLTAVDFDADS